MTILLTDASGFLGGWIARTLQPAAGELHVLARPNSDLTALQGIPFDVVEGDLLDPSSLAEALRGVRQVFHAGLMARCWWYYSTRAQSE